MAEGEVIVKTKVVAETSGADKAKAAIKGIGDEAKKQKSIASAAFGGFSSAVNAAGRAIGAFTKALGIIGFAIQGVQLAIDVFQKVKDWLDRDRKAAEELARAVQDAKNKAAVEASAAAYEKLNARIAEAVRLEQERDNNAAKRQSIERATEDARTELEMQKELAGLDRDDPDYASNAELVRSKYARIRAQRAADRALRDNNAQQLSLYERADANESRAVEYEKDVYGKSGDAVISLKNQIAKEKDPERKKSLDAQLDELIKQQRQKLDAVKKLRDEAESLRQEAASLVGGGTAALVSAKAVGVAQDAADADTRRRMAEARAAREAAAKAEADKAAAAAAQFAADRATAAKGRAGILELEASASSERAREQAARDRYSAEAGDVRDAQNAYDMLVANGGSRKDRSAALAALQKEQAEADEAKHEMERVAAQVASTLQGINAQIKALASAVQKAESRLAQNQADAPEG